MPDPRVERLADVLVRYSMGVTKGDLVLLMGPTTAEPLLRATYIRTLQAGGQPYLYITLPDQDELLFRYADDAQLDHIPPLYTGMIDSYNCVLHVISTDNTRALSNVDPVRYTRRSRAKGILQEILLRRHSTGALRWTGTLFPSNAFAQDADMSLTEYEDFVYGACLHGQEDPVSWWRDLARRQQEIIDWLEGRKSVHVIGPETDLHLSIVGRRFINCDGKENMPDGEVFTGPLEDSVEGHICFSFPAIHAGREVSGIRLTFEKGRVVKATADKNEDFLRKTLETDEGSSRVGEFAIATNVDITRFTRQLLFDEKLGGTCHLAVGAGLPETGSLNHSAIHWDMICDLRRGGEIRVDGITIHKEGRFVI